MSNYPCGVTYIPGDRGRDVVVEDCSQCDCELEFDSELEVYRRNGQFGHIAPTVEHFGKLFCSQKCLSQYTFDHAPEAVKTLLKTLAKAAYDLNEAIQFKSDRWCLEHSYVTHLLPRTALLMAAEEAQELLTLMGAEDEGPDWFLEATEGVPPANKPVRSAEVA